MRNQTSFIDRNFGMTVLFVFIVLFVPLMVREWISLRAEGMYNVEWHTTSMARLLERDLAVNRSLPDLISNLKNPETFDNFDNHVRQKIGFLGLRNIRIYDLSGEIIYAIDKDFIGKIFLPGENRNAAFAGNIVSELIDRDEYFDEYSQESSSDMAEVYVPIIAEGGEIPYVIEAYFDYTPITQRTNLLLIKSAASLLVTTLIVLVLLIYLYKGRQKMSRQVEALEAILPICMYCKKIRIEGEGQSEEWMNVESYFAEQDDLEFSHGICGDCLQKHYPDSKVAQKSAKKTNPVANIPV